MHWIKIKWISSLVFNFKITRLYNFKIEINVQQHLNLRDGINIFR